MDAPVATDVQTVDHDAIERVFQAQKAALRRLKATAADERRAKLARLKSVIEANADAIDAALHADLRKPRMGAQHFEIQSVLADIDLAIAELDDWMAPTPVEPSPRFAGARAHVAYEPRGVCLLFGAWNFPFHLVFSPLVPIVAAGNAAIVKPNELQPETSAVTARIVREAFSEDEVAVFEGGLTTAEALLDLPVDHIFFTGSPAVGKRIMAAAAKHLASVTLELGGKCPAILDETANLDAAAAKIVQARFMNAGQLCLAVDHVWVPTSRRDELVERLKAAVQALFYKDGALNTGLMARMVNARNMARVTSYLTDAKARGATIWGGSVDENDLTVHPAVITDLPLDSELMQHEIFGPLLPVIGYQDVDEAFDFLDAAGKPLALYLFSRDQAFTDRVLASTSSGGVTINDVLCHAMENRLPFGGVNQSGIGVYHGVHGFRELSHARSIFTQSNTG